jgi:hypothetical protein
MRRPIAEFKNRLTCVYSESQKKKSKADWREMSQPNTQARHIHRFNQRDSRELTVEALEHIQIDCLRFSLLRVVIQAQ